VAHSPRDGVLRRVLIDIHQLKWRRRSGAKLVSPISHGGGGGG
jgi:hypothetical protein